MTWVEDTIKMAKNASGVLQRYQEKLVADRERFFKLIKEQKMSCNWKEECIRCPLSAESDHNGNWFCSSNYRVCPYEMPEKVKEVFIVAPKGGDRSNIEIFLDENIALQHRNQKNSTFDPGMGAYHVWQATVRHTLPMTAEQAKENARKKLTEEEMELLGLK